MLSIISVPNTSKGIRDAGTDKPTCCAVPPPPEHANLQTTEMHLHAALNSLEFFKSKNIYPLPGLRKSSFESSSSLHPHFYKHSQQPTSGHGWKYWLFRGHQHSDRGFRVQFWSLRNRMKTSAFISSNKKSSPVKLPQRDQHTVKGFFFNLILLWWMSMANTQIKTSIYAVRMTSVHIILKTRMDHEILMRL